MDAAADRPEFAPPQEPAAGRGFALAVLAHLLLLYALMHGLHWQRELPDAVAEAELWSSLPQEAAPKPVPAPPPKPVVETPPAPPPPAPKPVVKAPPEPPVEQQPDIKLEQEKQRRALEKKRAEEERQRKLEEQRKLDAQRKAEEQRKLEAQKKREQELAAKKREEERQAAEAKRKEEERKRKEEAKRRAEAEAKAAKERERVRKDQLARMQELAGTGAPNATGRAAHSAGPSANWAGKVRAAVKPNIVFTDVISGNPRAEVDVKLAPDGTIVAKKLVRSSGVQAWDDAVLRALDKTRTLPRDTDGTMPSGAVLVFRPKD
jgi:colicin import membrane protein